MKISKIEKEALEFMLGICRSTHPKEFAGVLRAKGDTISEVLLLPGTLSSGKSAVLRLHMLPIDPTARGTIHSHPVPDAHPSSEDLGLFDKFGEVHLIVAYPYNKNSWAAYDHRGDKIELEVMK
ncbi:MAG: Mov34/MPN/PAD-1 family protein [Candidatus Hadarchaeota archaeon]